LVLPIKIYAFLPDSFNGFYPILLQHTNNTIPEFLGFKNFCLWISLIIEENLVLVRKIKDHIPVSEKFLEEHLK